MILRRTKMRSRCWNTWWEKIQVTLRHGKRWGQRYYYDSIYGGGGEKMFQRSNAAYERALALDPNRVSAASNLITNRVERGELGRAYDAATDLVRRRPQSADAHFALSYVLRYAGHAGAGRRRNATRPGRSIPGTSLSGHAPGHSWNWARRTARWTSSTWMQDRSGQRGRPRMCIWLREMWCRHGRRQECGEVSDLPSGLAGGVHAGATAGRYGPDCAGGGIVGDDGTGSGGVVSRRSPDGVLRAERSRFALLKAAVQQNYCAYSALLEDPLLKDLRKETAFNEVLTAASACQETLRKGASSKTVSSFQFPILADGAHSRRMTSSIGNW